MESKNNLHHNMPKTTFITGATSGIGEACAHGFAAIGHYLILNGRRLERLKKLKDEIEKQYNTRVFLLPFDVREQQAVEKAIETLPEDWRSIDILVNNAGLALGLESIEEGLISDWDQMIDTNIKGLLYVSRAVAPIMKERLQGHIINIGSIAGREVYPKGNVYCATKHAVDALSQAMRIDLLPYNIKVTQISPAATETEFSTVRFHGDEVRARNVYNGFKPLSGKDVAQVVVFSATLPAHVNINDLLLTPAAQATATLIKRVEK
jgi:NADP-dependent 3-hydroxy acid dehydrogenase YdfG